MDKHIVVYGPAITTGEAAPRWWRVLVALAARGHRVSAFVPDAPTGPITRGGLSLLPYPSQQQAQVVRALVCARGAAWVLKTSGVAGLDGYLDKGVRDLRRPGTLIGYWDLGTGVTCDLAGFDLLISETPPGIAIGHLSEEAAAQVLEGTLLGVASA